MGKTSVYLSDELTAAWKETGASLGELVRDGIAARQAAMAAVNTARLVILAALDEYAARHGSDTAGVPHIAPDTVPAVPSVAVPHTVPTADVPPAAARPERERKTATAPPPPLAADLAPPPRQASHRDACPHPKARVHKGLCGACGTHVGTS